MADKPTRRLLISPAAEADLAEIWAYIADDSSKAATVFVEQIEGKFRPLRDFPGIGSIRDQIASGLRALPYKNYVIYYVFTDADVTIVRVLHGARDVRALF
ncbi:MAG: type II toxin-antitoxin system RelE/ParE family toxin [Hyphomicrobium sp.]